MEVIGEKAPKIEKKEFLGRFTTKFPRYGTTIVWHHKTYRKLFNVQIFSKITDTIFSIVANQ